MTERITVCHLSPDFEVTFPLIRNTVAGLQRIVGGYFEAIGLPEQLEERGLLGLVDEDGTSKQLPSNLYATLIGRVLVGPIVIVRTDGSDFVTLGEDDIHALGTFFGLDGAVP